MALLLGTVFLFGATAYKPYIRFDMEVGQGEREHQRKRQRKYDTDDEVNEDTECTVCVWQSSADKRCTTGLENGEERGWPRPDSANGYARPDEIEMGGWDSNRDVFVETDCDDGMWIDQFIISRQEGCCSAKRKTWGSEEKHGSNGDGYCLSRQRSDWNEFRANVPEKKCYYKFRLKPNGQVTGWIAPAPIPHDPVPVDYEYMVTPVKTWTDAEAYCQSKGGHLASVHSKGEDERVAAFMRAHTTSAYPWLGGYSTSSNTPGTYKWSDGTAWDYMNPTWYRNDRHPNYVHYYRRAVWGTWCARCKSQGICAIPVADQWGSDDWKNDHPRGRRRLPDTEERLAVASKLLEEGEYFLDDGEQEEDLP